MDAELRRLRDEIEINRLIAAYSHAVMRLDAAGSAAVYTEDGVLSAFSGPEVVGRDKIERMLGKVYAPLRFLSQNCGSVVIHVDGDTARASSSVAEFVQYKEKDPLSCCFGNYDDTLVRTPDGWRFTKRRFNPFFSGSLQSEGTPFAPSETPHLYAAYPPAL